MTETKRIELKRLDDEGVGLAKIATLSAVDHDGDTYAPGAFGDQEVKVLAGHSWEGIPLGKGRVFERGDEAVAEFKLNLDTTAGLEWHKALKFDLANGKPLQEWSYGFQVLDSMDEMRDGKAIRVLKSLEVFEVSPVVKGAGVDTGTVAIKGKKAFLDTAWNVIEWAERLASEREAEGKPFRPAWESHLKELKDRLDALLSRVDDPTDTRKAEMLLAEFEAIRCGQKRS